MIDKEDTLNLLVISDKIKDTFYYTNLSRQDINDIIEAQVKIAYELGKTAGELSEVEYYHGYNVGYEAGQLEMGQHV